MSQEIEPKFIVDINAGKLVHWLRLMGYDAVLFNDKDDGIMIKTALQQQRIILTRDTEIFKRRITASGKVQAMLLEDPDSETQLIKVVRRYKLNFYYKPFSRCLECNEILQPVDKSLVRGLVPAFIYETQQNYMQCAKCNRIYWKGSHWTAMNIKLEQIAQRK